MKILNIIGDFSCNLVVKCIMSMFRLKLRSQGQPLQVNGNPPTNRLSEFRHNVYQRLEDGI